MNGMIWWFVPDGSAPPLDFPHFWIPKGPGDTWDDDPTVFKIEVAM